MLTFVLELGNSASAAVKYSDLSVPEKASVYESALILQQCLVGKVGRINEVEVKTGNVLGDSNGNMWTVWDKTIINYHQTLKSDDNVMSCSEYDNALVKGAINRLDIDPVDFVCSMGGQRRDFSECKDSSGDFKYPPTDGSDNPHKYTDADLVKYLKDTVGIDLNNPGNEVRYWRSYNIVSNYCTSSQAISKAIYDKENDNVRYALKDPITGADVYFLALSKKDEKPKYKDAEQGDVNCGTYYNRVNQYYEDYKKYIDRLTPAEREAENTSIIDSENPPVTGSGSSCKIEGIGWIICPVFDFMGEIVDVAYQYVDDLLSVQPLMTTGNSQGTYDAWVVMRNIANVAFVIAFIFIIFSQLTSIGISNYGVKKMLPRLVIAAVLVNVSFWVCAIAVDISNIIGSSIMSVFNNIGATIKTPVGLTDTGDRGNGWGGIITAVLGGTVALYAGLSALIPALLAVFVAIVTVFLVLVLRQALIILLVVVAPLAFVAYLLPNTEDWFTKWRKFLMTLLLMYPIIAAIFGASALASTIVMQAAGDNVVVQIMGAAIAIIPLAITPIVMKSAGGVLNRFAGIVNNAEKGPIDRLKKVSGNYAQSRKNLRNSKALSGKSRFTQLGRDNFVKWRARRAAIAGGRETADKEARRDYIGEQLGKTRRNGDVSRFATAVAAGDGQKGARLADKANAAAEAEDSKEAMQPLLRQLASMDPGEKRTHLDAEIVAGGARRSAAIQYAAQIGDTGFLRNHLAGRDSNGNSIASRIDPATGLASAEQTDVTRRIREGINSNAGAITGKAPDLVKGAGPAFGSIKGDDLVQFKPDTANAFVQHLQQLQTATTSIDPRLNAAQNAAAQAAAVADLDKAIDGFNSAVEDITLSPELQGKFSADVGREFAARTAGTSFQGRLSGLAGIQTDGKIR